MQEHARPRRLCQLLHHTLTARSLSTLSPPAHPCCAQFASTFECDTAGGFAWITLDPSLATLTGGGSCEALCLHAPARAMHANQTVPPA